MATTKLKGFDVISDKDADEWAKNSPEITWKHDKNYITAYRDGIELPIFIHKDKCLTKEYQFMWMQHMGDKNWVSAYDFKEAFIKALKSWDLWKI